MPKSLIRTVSFFTIEWIHYKWNHLENNFSFFPWTLWNRKSYQRPKNTSIDMLIKSLEFQQWMSEDRIKLFSLNSNISSIESSLAGLFWKHFPRWKFFFSLSRRPLKLEAETAYSNHFCPVGLLFKNFRLSVFSSLDQCFSTWVPRILYVFAWKWAKE